MVCKYFFPFRRLSSFRWLFLLLWRRFLVWFSPACLFLLLLLRLLVFYPENHCKDKCQEVYHEGAYIQVVNPFWVNFGEWKKIEVFHFCTPENPFSRNHLLRRLFSIEFSWLPSQYDCIGTDRCISGFSLLFCWCVSVLMPLPHGFDNYSFII